MTWELFQELLPYLASFAFGALGSGAYLYRHGYNRGWERGWRSHEEIVRKVRESQPGP